MKTTIVLSLAFITLITSMNAMEHIMTQDGETIQVIIESVGNEDPLQSQAQDNKPHLSTRSKIFAGLCAAGLCLGTTAAAGLAEYGAIKYVNEYDASDSNGAVWIGTAAGLGVCTLGMIVYAGGAGLINFCRLRSANEQTNEGYARV